MLSFENAASVLTSVLTKARVCVCSASCGCVLRTNREKGSVGFYWQTERALNTFCSYPAPCQFWVLSACPLMTHPVNTDISTECADACEDMGGRTLFALEQVYGSVQNNCISKMHFWVLFDFVLTSCCWAESWTIQCGVDFKEICGNCPWSTQYSQPYTELKEETGRQVIQYWFSCNCDQGRK